MRRGIVVGGVAALIAGLSVLGVHLARSERPRAEPAPTSSAQPAKEPPTPSAEELALLSPIATGSEIAGFRVLSIHGVENGVLRVVCRKDKAIVRLDVALLDDDGPVPPATAGKLAVFYSLFGALPEEGAELARKLADVLAAHPRTEPPRGMTKFTPKEKPGVAL